LPGLQLSKSRQLRKLHTAAWTSLWRRGVIEVDGDLQLARCVSASQYYLLSSVPDADDPLWPFVGLSPSGLAWGDEQVTNERLTLSLSAVVQALVSYTMVKKLDPCYIFK